LNKKLWLLNLLLAGAAAYGGVQLRKEWHAAKDREAATLGKKVKPPATRELQPLPAEQPVLATSYAPVAQKFLFDRERNPNVVVEVKAPPPPPPMPALPVFRGMLELPSRAPVAFLSVTPDGAQQGVHPGEPIGPFKLVAVNSEEITFEWNGQKVTKRVDELPRGTAPPPEAQAADRGPAAPAAAAPPPAPPPTGPGAATPFGGERTCAMNDGHNEGDVVDGYKKVVFTTPFGKNCTYQPVSK
jgi:hypothetical protein